VKWVVVTEMNKPWVDWAGPKQFLLWPFSAQVAIPGSDSLNAAASKLEKAAQLAGGGGVILLSVGHGGSASTGDGGTDEGFFDLAPHNFRVAGNNAILTGQTGSTGKTPAEISVYYDVAPKFADPKIKAKSRKEQDEEDAQSNDASVSRLAKTRLANWERYLKVGKAFQANRLGAMILLTCKVGLATDFLKRARTQLGVPIAAYKSRVLGNPVTYYADSAATIPVATRTRIYLEGDKDGQGTNVEMGEFWIPMPPQSVWTVIP